MATDGACVEASGKSSFACQRWRIVKEHLYRHICVWIWTPCRVLLMVACFIYEALGVYRTCVFRFIPSASDALEPESRAIVKMLRSMDCSSPVSGANSDTPVCSPDLSS